MPNIIMLFVLSVTVILNSDSLFQVSHVECVTREEAHDFVEDDTTHG